jgi:hypothetical protein
MKFRAKVASVWYGHNLGVGREIELDGVFAEKALRQPGMFEPMEAEEPAAPARRAPGRPRRKATDEDAQ